MGALALPNGLDISGTMWGTLLLVGVLVAYTIGYKFASTGLVDSLVLTVNLATLTLLVPMILDPGRVPQTLVTLVIFFFLALPMLTQLAIHDRVREKQKEQIRLKLTERAKIKDADRREEVTKAFAELAELLIGPDCDPTLHHGITYETRTTQRSVFRRALAATRLFEDIPLVDLEIPDGLRYGRLYRWTVAIPSAIAFLLACSLFLMK
jgi:hypothetical protein